MLSQSWQCQWLLERTVPRALLFPFWYFCNGKPIFCLLFVFAIFVFNKWNLTYKAIEKYYFKSLLQGTLEICRVVSPLRRIWSKSQLKCTSWGDLGWHWRFSLDAETKGQWLALIIVHGPRVCKASRKSPEKRSSQENSFAFIFQLGESHCYD